MDYDAVTGRGAYAPDEQNQQIDVLTPLVPGTDPVPREPNQPYSPSRSTTVICHYQ